MEYILMSCQVGGLLEEGMRNVNLELCSWQVATIFTFSYIFHQYTNGVFSSGRLAIWTPVHFKPKKDHLEKLKVYRGASHICQWKSVSYHSAHTSMFAWSSGWCWSTLPCNLNSSPSIEERWVGQSSKWPENMTKNMKKKARRSWNHSWFCTHNCKGINIFHTSCNCRCELYQSQNQIMMNHMKGNFFEEKAHRSWNQQWFLYTVARNQICQTASL